MRLESKQDITRETSRVKKILVDRGWTTPKLAARFDVSRCHICNLLYGRDRPKLLQNEIARLIEMDSKSLWGLFHHSLRAADPLYKATSKLPHRHTFPRHPNHTTKRRTTTEAPRD
jgi:hypothetical protein